LLPNDSQRTSRKPILILVNEHDGARKVYGRFLSRAFPAAEIVAVENIADVYGAVRRIAEKGHRVAAIVSDEVFETKEDWSCIRASREVPHLREALERSFDDGSTIPVVLVSGGAYFTSPPDHAYFLDLRCWHSSTWNETNPLYHLLNAALGPSHESLDRNALRRTTGDEFWGEKRKGSDLSR
jgi:hypothetical protein